MITPKTSACLCSSILTKATAISATEARKIAALDSAGFTNRFATDKARQGISSF
jgi:hypothetical protein